MTTSSGLKEIYSPKSQIGDYDSSHIRFLLDTAIYYQQKALNSGDSLLKEPLIYYVFVIPA